MIAGDISVITRNISLSSSREDEKKCYEIAHTLGFELDIMHNSTLKKKGTYKNTRIYKVLKKSLERDGIKNYYISKSRKNNHKKINIFIEIPNKNIVYKISFLWKKLYSKTTYIVVLWGVSSSIILLLIAFIFLKNQIRPIKRLAKAAQCFGEGKDYEYHRPQGASEVRQAWISFYDMKSRIQKLLMERMNTLAGISHDLRTPLTRMKLQLSIMKDTPEKKDLLNDIDIMTSIINTFMIHVKNNNNNNEKFENKNLKNILEESARQYINSNNDSFKIHINGDEDIYADVKYISFRRAIGNIISNAKKYAKNLYISFHEEQDNIMIYFEDDGKGIDPSIKDDIFMPFITENKARTMSNTPENIGLGLSIVKEIIENHNGKIMASNSEKYKGAQFLIVLRK